MNRLQERDATMLRMASNLASLATCCKLQVGCVLTDMRGRVLSAGFNGPASMRPHCTGNLDNEQDPCHKFCQATHAESNAIISCRAPAHEIHTCYVTWSPCVACCKQLVQTGCKRIVFLFESAEVEDARQFWIRAAAHEHRLWERFVSVQL